VDDVTGRDDVTISSKMDADGRVYVAPLGTDPAEPGWIEVTPAMAAALGAPAPPLDVEITHADGQRIVLPGSTARATLAAIVAARQPEEVPGWQDRGTSGALFGQVPKVAQVIVTLVDFDGRSITHTFVPGPDPAEHLRVTARTVEPEPYHEITLADPVPPLLRSPFHGDLGFDIEIRGIGKITEDYDTHGRA
jgi:hypothetical protein